MSLSKTIEPLPPGCLYNTCDPAGLGFTTTAELQHLDKFFGQERAVDALKLGVGIRHEGYNIFVLGPSDMGKHEMIGDFLRQHATNGQQLCDWCYINNFAAPQKPLVLQLPPGKACELQKDMKHCVEEILVTIPGVFQSTEYKIRLAELNEEHNKKEHDSFHELAEKAHEKSIALVQTPSGYTLTPVADDKILTPAEFDALPEEEQEQIKKNINELKVGLKKIVLHLPSLMKESRTRFRNLNRNFTQNAVNQIFKELEAKYAQLPDVAEFLETVKKDVVENVDKFNIEENASLPDNTNDLVNAFPIYMVNVLVDNDQLQGVPVIYENNPSLVNLIGRVEHESQMGALTTNLMLIKPGALHRANGGFLLLDARKLLMQPFSWDALKRALQAQQVKIESANQILSLVSTKVLEPEPVPLNLKVVLMGDRMTYYLLQAYDPDFRALFKVPADISDDISRSPETISGYARLIASIQIYKALRSFDSGAVARIIEQGSRKLGDANKLSLNLNELTDLLCESDHFASCANASVVNAEHVQNAITAADLRLAQFRELTRDSILRNIQLVATEGKQVAQINGLSIYQLGEAAFGCPTRITATARLGRGKVLDIEREVKMGGNIHSKAVMILTSLIANRYARNQPLPLSASLVFEQSYGGVDGDSASIAEFVALLSAISEIPIQQSLAVTGSLNQHGQVQAIGGVNQKIEGFYEICVSRGLNGRQGVVIPSANIQHLMLEQGVVDAVASGRFFIYAINTIDEAASLLLDAPADTIHAKVEVQVQEWIKLSSQYLAHTKGSSDDDKNKD